MSIEMLELKFNDMNFTRLPKRSCSSIVQQMNCASTKQIFKDFYSGKPIDLPAGSDNRSFDFDDQSSVDFDQDFFRDAENLIDQHFMQQKVVDSFKVSPAPVPAPAPDPASSPAPAE